MMRFIEAIGVIRGLYGVTPEMEDTARLLGLVRAALRGGMGVLQYRVKRLPAQIRHEQLEALSGLCQAYGIPLLINDAPRPSEQHLADGWHLGRDDGLPQEWPQMASRGILGLSCYADSERAVAAAAAGAHYVALGSFFPSRTKPEAPAVSWNTLRETRAKVDIPIVAIGGITPERASLLRAAGVDAVAVLSDLFTAPDVEEQAAAYCRVFA